MKKLILVVLLLSSCSEEETPVVTGDWLFYTIDVTESKPNLSATFKIYSDDDQYLIKDLSVYINETPTNGFTSIIQGHGSDIDKISISNGVDEISMYGGIFLRTDWVLFDSVIFMQQNIKHWYPGQRLIRP